VTEIIAEQKGQTGVITLNRPQALNALTLSMVRDMTRALKDWGRDPSIHAAIIEGAGGKAFCAGGDVKSVALAARAGDAAAGEFFREEYTLNHLIHSFPKPYIALIDGIVMGGGVGISAHGSHRIVTENMLFAMPEANIGFFPDVGGGYVLPRMKGAVGTYLALTTYRMRANDALYAGFATHAVRSADVGAIKDTIIANPRDLNAILAAGKKPELEPAPLQALQEKIDTIFAQARVEDILAALEKDGSDWARETLKTLRGLSPASLKLAREQLRRGKTMDFRSVMTMEYRLSQACLKGHDFFEGVRAALIDKDKNPQWRPPRVEEVKDGDIAAAFEKGEGADLVLPEKVF